MSVVALLAAVEQVPGDAPPRHIDVTTALLDRYAREWLDWQKRRKAMSQRELPDALVADVAKIETRVSSLLTKTLRQHVLWPWLAQFPGLGGAHTALIIGRIGDPRRYPGQRCSEGHYLPPLYEVGDPCPIAERRLESERDPGDGAEIPGADDGCLESGDRCVCPGVMLPPRTTTGVRSLWHWMGLHADDDGRAPRKRKGVQSDWEPRARASVMQPGGISEQIVRLNVPYYADVYRETKARLILRVPEEDLVSEGRNGDAEPLRAAGCGRESDVQNGRPLRLYEADRIARKVAAKAFVADLLITWKGLA